MHGEAYWFIRDSLGSPNDLRGKRVLEFGSRDVNGSPRELMPADVTYVGVDIADGPGVDIVGNAAIVRVFGPEIATFDIVICAEVAEHTPFWKGIIQNAWNHLHQGGLFIFTAATDPRPPHSAVDGHNMEPSEYHSGTFNEGLQRQEREYYQNVDPNELAGALANAGFHDIAVKTHPRGDVYATAVA